jgi:hypothetical protein
LFCDPNSEGQTDILEQRQARVTGDRGEGQTDILEQRQTLTQSDQIWRIFAYWVIVFFEHLLESYRSSPILVGYFFPR